MDVSVQRDDATGGTAVLTVVGDLDVESAYDVYLAAIGQGGDGVRLVVLDLAGVDFVDSTGLGMLIRSRDELRRDHEARLRLRAPSERVSALLRMTALTAEFDIEASTAGPEEDVLGRDDRI